MAALFAIAKCGNNLECPLTDKWINKMWCVCVCVYICICGVYTYILLIHKTQWSINSSIKRNEIMLFAVTWMDLEIIMLSEVR